MQEHSDISIHVGKASPIRLFLLYCSCMILVVLFVHFYLVYIFTVNIFGNGIIVVAPFVLPCVALAIIFSPLQKRLRVGVQHYTWIWIIAGVLLCILSLSIPDPKIAVKRIHVTEYLLLSLLVRYTLSHKLSGLNLLFFATLLTSLFGIHDEFLQGLHPQRTYGLRDMLVNSVSATGGSFIWHGMHMFTADKGSGAERSVQPLVIGYTLWLLASVILLIVPIGQLKESVIPVWTLLPLGSAMLCYSCLLVNKHIITGHGLTALSLFSFSLLVYPVVINVFEVPFF